MTVARGTFHVVRGAVKYAYTTAADVKNVTIKRDELTREVTLTGAVVSHNPYLLAQRPLEFVIPNGARWPLDGVAVTNGHLVARVILEG